jgi:hypothetical protein
MTNNNWHDEYLDTLDELTDVYRLMQGQLAYIHALEGEIDRLEADPLIECRTMWTSTKMRLSEWEEWGNRADALLDASYKKDGDRGRHMARPWRRVRIPTRASRYQLYLRSRRRERGGISLKFKEVME